MKRVRCLYRVSSKQQLHDDDIPMQRAECKKFIEKFQDWSLEYEYVEKAISGFKMHIKDRDVLMEIMQDAQNKEFDILVVYMSDRIGRKEDEIPAYVAGLNNLGIEIWSVNEGSLKTEEHIDKLMNYIRFWQAEGESRKTGMRVKAAQKEMVKSGKFVGGNAPFGYQLVLSGEISNHGRALKRLVIKEDKAKIVREIFRLAAEEDLGAFAIAKRLNEKKVPAINGEEWKSCTVSAMLKNPVYMGYITYGRREYHGNYTRIPPEYWTYSERQLEEIVIIPRNKWEEVQCKRENRKAGIRIAQERTGSYGVTTTGKLPLMGIAYCGYCGTRLTNGSRYDTWITKNGKKVKKVCGRYRCTQKGNASIKCNGNALYRQEQIEPIIFEVVGHYMDTLQSADVYQDIINMQENVKKKILKDLGIIKKEEKEIMNDISTLEAQIPIAIRGDGLFSQQKLSSILNDKEKILFQTRSRYDVKKKEYEQTTIKNKELKKIGDMIPNWREEFVRSNVHQKKILLAKIIERIDVKRDSLKIKFKISQEAFEPLKSIDSPTTPYRPCSEQMKG